MGLIGDMLRQAREKQDLTLKQIEDETNMRWKYLEALENEEYHVIPGETYVKGFLRNYSAFLGLDCDRILEMYKEQVAEKEKAEVLEKRSEERRTKKEERRQTKGPNKTLWAAVAVIAVLVVAGVSVLGNQKGAEKPPKAPATQNQPVPKETPKSNPEPTTPPQTAPAPTPAPAQPSQPTPAGPVKVDLSVAGQHSWVRVLVDGNKVFEGFIEPGQTKSFSGNKVWLRVGDAGVVSLVVNGQNLGKLGASGQVVEKSFPE